MVNRLWGAPLLVLLGCAPAPSPAPPPPLPPPPTQAPPVALVPPPPEPAAPAPEPSPPPACEPLALEVPPPIEVTGLDVEQPDIEDEPGVLAPFYEKLAALRRGQAKDHVRIAVYGDSNMTADWITGEMRRVLQKKLGEGGHGFVALGRPWPGYLHQDVVHDLNKFSWMIFAVSTAPVQDYRFGFAGIAVQSMGPLARTWVQTAGERSSVGRQIGRAGVHYLKGPKMGSFDIVVDKQRVATVATEANDFEAGYHRVEVPEGPHKVTFVSKTSKPVRLFGATLERSEPGIIVDSLGVGASNTETMTRQNNKIYRESLAHRGHDLIVFLHGTFDVVPWGSEEKHAAWVKKMVDIHRAAVPDVPILILSPPDRLPGKNAIKSRPEPAEAGRQKRIIARDLRCAFWDFRAAMGGDLSMGRFYRKRMADGDLIHFNQKGGAYMGSRVAGALLRGLAGHAKRNPQAGCPPRGAPPAAQPAETPSGARPTGAPPAEAHPGGQPAEAPPASNKRSESTSTSTGQKVTGRGR
jgi:hypothetical protein